MSVCCGFPLNEKPGGAPTLRSLLSRGDKPVTLSSLCAREESVYHAVHGVMRMKGGADRSNVRKKRPLSKCQFQLTVPESDFEQFALDETSPTNSPQNLRGGGPMDRTPCWAVSIESGKGHQVFPMKVAQKVDGKHVYVVTAMIPTKHSKAKYRFLLNGDPADAAPFKLWVPPDGSQIAAVTHASDGVNRKDWPQMNIYGAGAKDVWIRDLITYEVEDAVAAARSIGASAISLIGNGLHFSMRLPGAAIQVTGSVPGAILGAATHIVQVPIAGGKILGGAVGTLGRMMLETKLIGDGLASRVFSSIGPIPRTAVCAVGAVSGLAVKTVKLTVRLTVGKPVGAVINVSKFAACKLGGLVNWVARSMGGVGKAYMKADAKSMSAMLATIAASPSVLFLLGGSVVGAISGSFRVQDEFIFDVPLFPTYQCGWDAAFGRPQDVPVGSQVGSALAGVFGFVGDSFQAFKEEAEGNRHSWRPRKRSADLGMGMSLFPQA